VNSGRDGDDGTRRHGSTLCWGSAVGTTAYATGFFNYYVANAGAGTIEENAYVGVMIPETIPVPAVHVVASWWSQ